MNVVGKDLWVKDVTTTSQGVEITIATDDDVRRVLKERTLLFDSITCLINVQSTGVSTFMMVGVIDH